MPTMIRDAAISFPMLGGLTLDFPASFELFGHTFYLYGVVMAIGYDQNALAERRHPTKDVLDEVGKPSPETSEVLAG